jgi:mannitol/fructose-specific phosphotransferase system IIA component (Ntr-type)
MLVNLDAKTREEAVEQLAYAMEKNGFIANAGNLVTAALERESILSTAIGDAIAMPHVRGVEGGALTLAMGVSPEGIDWDGEKVNFVFLSAIPVAVSAFYLRLMSGITQAFSKDANRKAALAAENPAALWKVLQKATRATVK